MTVFDATMSGVVNHAAALLAERGPMGVREILDVAWDEGWYPEIAANPGQSLGQRLAADARFAYDRETKRWRRASEEQYEAVNVPQSAEERERTIYARGAHSRDDELAALRAEVARLTGERDRLSRAVWVALDYFYANFLDQRDAELAARMATLYEVYRAIPPAIPVSSAAPEADR